MESNICEFCLQPKESQRSGSITQWVSVCQCAQKSEEEQYESLKICSSCHKKINLARHGTFTQWIFRTEFCKCYQPQIQPKNTRARQEEIQKIKYPECEVESDFPYDRFSPIEILGRGRNGIVYRSQDKLLKKIVAVKVLQNLNPEEIISFQQEAKIISQLNHPNIINIVDISVTEDGTPYIVLEYILGVSLKQFFLIENASGLTETIALKILIQLADALQHAHEKQMYHRDLKPENILITRDDCEEPEVKIIDFGLATTIKGNVEYKGKALAGTPPYMSPDQAAGLPFDARSELYSLGCILFECLTGKPPFESDTALEVLHKQLNENPPDLENSVSCKFTGLAALVNRLLKKDPELRYQSAEKLKADLIATLEPGAQTVDTAITTSDKGQNLNPKPFLVAGVSLTLVALSIFLFSGYEEKPHYKESAEVKNPDDDVYGGMFPAHNRFDHFDETKQPGQIKANELVDDKSLERLQNRTDIHNLDLSNTMIDGSGLKYLVKLPLSSLMLDKCDITDEDMKLLYPVKTLKMLGLSYTKVEGIGFDKFQALNSLGIYESNVGDPGMMYISKIKPLRHLHISGRLITGTGINHLAENSNIKIITLEGNDDLSSILSSVKNIKSLRRLRFAVRNLRKSDLEQFRKSGIKDLHLWTCTNSPGCLEELAKCKNLKNLVLSYGYLNDAELQFLKKSLPDCVIQVVSLQNLKDKRVIRSLMEYEKDEKGVSDFLNK